MSNHNLFEYYTLEFQCPECNTKNILYDRPEFNCEGCGHSARVELSVTGKVLSHE
jgi:ribosomal protein S27E